MSAEAPAPGTIVGGKFKILRRLGVGGMGAVYEIEHVFTHHRRALKLLHREVASHPAIVERFLREASAAGRIGNPHIVETFDAGTLDSGEPYLVMELLNGQELSQLIRTRGRLPIDVLSHILRQACNGIQAAHDAGVVHRDLKPDNLFVCEREGRPFVKILDFGISKFDPTLTGDHAMTREGSVLGTPYYMPPEQVRGATDLDARADIYALGVIAYEAASGRRPFDADTLPHLALLIHEGSPTPLRELCPDAPTAFCGVVEHAMATKREARIATARALASALEPFERGEVREAYAATLLLEESALGAPAKQAGAAVIAQTAILDAAPAITANAAPAITANAATGADSKQASGGPPSIEAGGLGRTVAQTPERGRGRFIAGALAAVVLVGFGGVYLTGVARSSSGAGPEPSSQTSALPQESASSSGPEVAPSTAPEPIADSAVPVPSTAAAAHPAPGTKPPLPKGSAGQTPPAAPSTKAKKTGLDENNPY